MGYKYIKACGLIGIACLIHTVQFIDAALYPKRQSDDLLRSPLQRLEDSLAVVSDARDAQIC